MNKKWNDSNSHDSELLDSCARLVSERAALAKRISGLETSLSKYRIMHKIAQFHNGHRKAFQRISIFFLPNEIILILIGLIWSFRATIIVDISSFCYSCLGLCLLINKHIILTAPPTHHTWAKQDRSSTNDPGNSGMDLEWQRWPRHLIGDLTWRLLSDMRILRGCK